MMDPIVGTWLVPMGFPEESPIPWVFDPEGSILIENREFGRWTRLHDGSYQLAIRLPDGRALDMAAVRVDEELPLYLGGRRLFTAVRSHDEAKTPAQEIHQEVETDCYEPWIGCWVIPDGRYLELEFVYPYHGQGEPVKTTTHSRKARQAGVLETRADGTYSCHCEGQSGRWERAADGRLLLDRGSERERYYDISRNLMRPERTSREGPFREDGSDFYRNKRYLFIELTGQPAFPEPEVPVARPDPRVSTRPTGWNGQTDWREEKRKELRERGRWSGWVGGCRVTSSKDPDDWEHPHLK